MKACQTSWRLRYSKETSRRTWRVGVTSFIRSKRSRSVRYRPLERKVSRETKDAMLCIVVRPLRERESRRRKGDSSKSRAAEGELRRWVVSLS